MLLISVIASILLLTYKTVFLIASAFEIRLIIASAGGFLSWLLFVILNNFIHNDPINYFFVAFAVSVYAEIMARVLKTPTTLFITTSLIPLIPGGSLYYTMAYAFDSSMGNFFEKGTYTLELAAALALGIIVATTAVKIVINIVKKQNYA